MLRATDRILRYMYILAMRKLSWYLNSQIPDSQEINVNINVHDRTVVRISKVYQLNKFRPNG